MVGQLPKGLDGVVAASLIVAALSLVSSSLLIWLTWVHDERLSYVAMLAYFAFVSTTCSVIQQGHTIADFHNIQQQSFAEIQRHPTDPETRLVGGTVGMDLALFYIQFYCYEVMGLLVLWWASELTQSVYGLTRKKATRRILRKVNACGKVFALAFPLITVLIMRSPPVKASQMLYTVITDVPLGLSMGIGSLLMLAILGRYIYSRRRLLKFDPAHGVSSTDPESQTSSKAGSRVSKISKGRNRAIYDRWLLARFSVAFFFLALFQGTATLFQQISIKNSKSAAVVPGPKLDANNARREFLLFLPGNIPGIALFIVFGTTTAFRKHIFKTCQALWKAVVKSFQPKAGRVYDEMPSPSASHVFQLQAVVPDLMKSLPRRPASQVENKVECLHSKTKGLQPPGPYSIHVMRTLSVQMTTATGNMVDDGNATDSSHDSSPSLLIMRPSLENQLNLE